MTVNDWPEAALILLDSLWNDVRMEVIRRRMYHRFGFYPTALEVREAATRYSDKKAVNRQHTADRAIDLPVVPIEPAPCAAPPAAETVRVVPPGSFPANRFSMLGGRLR